MACGDETGARRLLEQGGARWLRERDKASVRAKVEHPFLYVKRRFGYRKVRYRGLAKNMERIALLLASRTCLWRAAIRRRERPARETSAHAGRNEGIIGQNMPVWRVFSPSSPPRPLKPAPSVPHRPQKGLAQSFPRGRPRAPEHLPACRAFLRPTIADMRSGNLTVKHTAAAVEIEAALPDPDKLTSWARDALLAVEAGQLRGISPGSRCQRRAASG